MSINTDYMRCRYDAIQAPLPKSTVPAGGNPPTLTQHDAPPSLNTELTARSVTWSDKAIGLLHLAIKSHEFNKIQKLHNKDNTGVTLRKYLAKQRQITVNLSDINLKGADLSELNLRGLNLRGANLKGANLQNTNLQWTNLQWTNLKGANLEGANLKNTNLQWTNLQWANLKGTNFQGANFQGADLENADLENADLEKANLDYATFKETNLKNTNLNRTSLVETNLQGADFQGASLNDAYLKKTNLQKANFQGVNFQRTIFKYANFQEACLQNTQFSNMVLKGTDFTNANLKNTTMSNMTLSSVKLYKTDLQGVQWNNITFTNKHNFSTAVFDEISSFSPPLTQNRDNLFMLLKTVDSLGEGQRTLKEKIINQVITNTPNGNISDLIDRLWSTKGILSIKKTLLDGLYNREADTYKDLILPSDHIACRHFHRRLKIRLQILKLKDETASIDCMNSHNLLFIQRVRHGLLSSNGAVKKLAKSLYNTYLQQESLEWLANNGLVGNMSGETPLTPDWTEPSLANFVLVNGNHVMALSQHSLNFLLGKTYKTTIGCSRILYYDNKENTRAPENMGVYLSQHFPVLLLPYTKYIKSIRLSKFIKSLHLGTDYESTFLNALELTNCTNKLTSPEEQRNLLALFNPKFQNPDANTDMRTLRNMRLTDPHLREVLKALEVDQHEPTIQAQTLLIIAAVFVKYSSSAIFGDEDCSPLALRAYAAALINEARDLDEKLLCQESYKDWMGCLTGRDDQENKVFSCTSELFEEIKPYIKHNLLGNNNQLTLPVSWL